MNREKSGATEMSFNELLTALGSWRSVPQGPLRDTVEHSSELLYLRMGCPSSNIHLLLAEGCPHSSGFYMPGSCLYLPDSLREERTERSPVHLIRDREMVPVSRAAVT